MSKERMLAPPISTVGTMIRTMPATRRDCGLMPLLSSPLRVQQRKRFRALQCSRGLRRCALSLQHCHLFLSELQRGCSYVLLKVRDRGGAWDGQHHGRVAKEPGERHLRWGGLVALGDLLEGSTCPRQPPSGQRVPGYESYPLPLT